jgi:hypothetical protein
VREAAVAGGSARRGRSASARNRSDLKIFGGSASWVRIPPPRPTSPVIGWRSRSGCLCSPAARWAHPGRLGLTALALGLACDLPCKSNGLVQRRVWEKRPAEVGIREFAAHDLRRAYIGAPLGQGAGLSVASELAGHSSPTATKRYERREGLGMQLWGRSRCRMCGGGGASSQPVATTSARFLSTCCGSSVLRSPEAILESALLGSRRRGSRLIFSQEIRDRLEDLRGPRSVVAFNDLELCAGDERGQPATIR